MLSSLPAVHQMFCTWLLILGKNWTHSLLCWKLTLEHQLVIVWKKAHQCVDFYQKRTYLQYVCEDSFLIFSLICWCGLLTLKNKVYTSSWGCVGALKKLINHIWSQPHPVLRVCFHLVVDLWPKDAKRPDRRTLFCFFSLYVIRCFYVLLSYYAGSDWM